MPISTIRDVEVNAGRGWMLDAIWQTGAVSSDDLIQLLGGEVKVHKVLTVGEASLILNLTNSWAGTYQIIEIGTVAAYCCPDISGDESWHDEIDLDSVEACLRCLLHSDVSFAPWTNALELEWLLLVLLLLLFGWLRRGGII